jgi:hypothetical protein
MEITAGTWEVTASLEGFLTGVVPGVVVVVEQTTPDVDFFLYQIANVGYVEGFVSLVNGTGDVTEATVSATGQSTHPMENGYYYLALPEGTYTVMASHPYAESDSITGITVVMGQTVSDVDFELVIVRCDLICMAMDQFGFPLYDVGVNIIGPEETLTGTVTGDSLVFEHVLYGQYYGTAWLATPDTAYANDELNSTDHDIVFVFIEVGMNEVNKMEDNTLLVSPNPSSGNTTITVQLNDPAVVTLKIYAQNGQLIRTLAESKLDAGIHQVHWNGTNDSGQAVAPGIYSIVLQHSAGKLSKVLIRLP